MNNEISMDTGNNGFNFSEEILEIIERTDDIEKALAEAEKIQNLQEFEESEDVRSNYVNALSGILEKETTQRDLADRFYTELETLRSINSFSIASYSRFLSSYLQATRRSKFDEEDIIRLKSKFDYLVQNEVNGDIMDFLYLYISWDSFCIACQLLDIEKKEKVELKRLKLLVDIKEKLSIDDLEEIEEGWLNLFEETGFHEASHLIYSNRANEAIHEDDFFKAEMNYNKIELLERKMNAHQLERADIVFRLMNANGAD